MSVDTKESGSDTTVPLLGSTEPDSTKWAFPDEDKREPITGLGVDDLLIESRDFEDWENDVLHIKEGQKSEESFSRESLVRWGLTFLIGVAVAAVGAIIAGGTLYIMEYKFHLIYDYIESNYMGFAWFVYTAINLGLVLVACLLTVFVEPAAAGGGIVEVKCTLNGMNIPRAIRIKTLFVKIVGIICGVGSGLPIGKEGPMVHAGAIVAAGLSQGKSTTFGFDTSFSKFSAFRNDREKRDFISCGAACGVASAFGAPIGGVLFSLEEGSSFWAQSLTWRTFFCAMISTASVSVFLSLTFGILGGGSEATVGQIPGMFTFGDFNQAGQNAHTYELYEIPLFMAVGVLGGLFGALFNAGAKYLYQWRSRKIGRTKWKKVLEAVLTSIIVSSLGFCIPYVFSDCAPMPTENDIYKDNLVQMSCKAGTFNEIATLFFSPAENAIKQLFHSTHSFSLSGLALFYVVYFFIFLWSAGLSLPAGMFIPSLLLGSAMGRLFGEVFANFFPNTTVNAGTYSLIGAAALLAGSARMTISLAIIMVESTGDIQYGLPLIFTLIMAKFIGDRLTPGLYDIMIELKHWPFLEPDPPKVAIGLQAKHVMNTHVKTLGEVCLVSDILEVLNDVQANVFCVVEPWNGIGVLYAPPSFLANQKLEPHSPPKDIIYLNPKRRNSIDMYIRDHDENNKNDNLESPDIKKTGSNNKNKKLPILELTVTPPSSSKNNSKNINNSNTTFLRELSPIKDENNNNNDDEEIVIDLEDIPRPKIKKPTKDINSLEIIRSYEQAVTKNNENKNNTNNTMNISTKPRLRKSGTNDTSDITQQTPDKLFNSNKSKNNNTKMLVEMKKDGNGPSLLFRSLYKEGEGHSSSPVSSDGSSKSSKASQPSGGSHSSTTSSSSSDHPSSPSPQSLIRLSTSDDENLPTYGHLRGIILRKHLLVILKKKAFFPNRITARQETPHLTWEDLESGYPRYPKLSEIEISPEERNSWVDLTAYLHSTPTTVFAGTPLPQAYTVFRTLGLRHLPVLNIKYELVGLVTRKSLTERWIKEKRKCELLSRGQ